MNKLYCFQYNIKEDLVYRQEYKTRESDKYDFLFYTVGKEPDDYTSYISKDTLDKPQKEGDVIYVFTLTDNVNDAMDLIYEAIKTTIQSKKKELEELDKMFDTFDKKRMDMFREFPDGKKRRIEREDIER